MFLYARFRILAHGASSSNIQTVQRLKIKSLIYIMLGKGIDSIDIAPSARGNSSRESGNTNM